MGEVGDAVAEVIDVDDARVQFVGVVFGWGERWQAHLISYRWTKRFSVESF